MSLEKVYERLLNEVDYRTVQSSDPSKQRSVRGVDTSNVTQFTDPDPKRKKVPADKGFRDERSAQALIRNSIRLLKTDGQFRNKLNELFEQYRSEIQQESDIDAESEKVLIYSVAAIQKAQSELTTLEDQRAGVERELAKPGLSDSARAHYMERLNGTSATRRVAFTTKDKETGKIVTRGGLQREDPGILAKIEKLKKSIKNHQEKVDEALEKATGDVIPIADKYIDPVVSLINNTAKGLLDSVESEKDQSTETTIKNLDDLNVDDFSAEKLLEANVRVELLKMLASDDPQHNPVVRYLDMKAKAFDPEKVKEYAYRGGYNANVSKNLINNALPLSQLIRYYNVIKDDEPLKVLSSLQVKTKGKANDALALLNIKTKEEFESKKEQLRDLINSLNIDEHRKKAALFILSEPFVKRGATAADRLRGLLGGIIADMTRESYDETVNSILLKYIV